MAAFLFMGKAAFLFNNGPARFNLPARPVLG